MVCETQQFLVSPFEMPLDPFVSLTFAFYPLFSRQSTTLKTTTPDTTLEEAAKLFDTVRRRAKLCLNPCFLGRRRRRSQSLVRP